MQFRSGGRLEHCQILHLTHTVLSVDLALHLCIPFVNERCFVTSTDDMGLAQERVMVKGGRIWLAVSDVTAPIWLR